MVHHRHIMAGLCLGLLLLGGRAAQAEKVLRVGMTLSDIPATHGQPDQGAEGQRFIGVTLFEPLIAWDLTSTDKPAGLVPALAESWSSDAADRTKWTFKLRRDVKFHDGTSWNAAAAIWNLDKLFRKDAPQYDARQVGLSYGALAGVADYRILDDDTIEIRTKQPDALFPYSLTSVNFVSPSQWEKVGRDWAAFARQPAGTGPWKLDKLVPRERAELVRFAAHWNSKRIARTDRLVLLPMPDSTTRSAALLAGQVDWIEAPATDVIDKLKSAGFTISTGAYPHIWPWMLNVLPDSPLADVKVRRALNLAVNRSEVMELVGGLGYEAVGAVRPESPWWGKPSFAIKYDPEQARKLLAEAGYGPGKPLQLKVLISASGSGQMQPLSMNELIQENLAKIGVKVDYEVLEWNALRARRNAGAQAAENKGIHGVNSSWVTTDPYFGFLLMLDSANVPPKGINWGNVKDEVIDELSGKIRLAFDPAEQDRLMAQLHARFVDQAYWLFVAHDAQPRALSPKIIGFRPAQSWLQDLATVELK